MSYAVKDFNIKKREYFHRWVRLMASTGLPLSVYFHSARWMLRQGYDGPVLLAMTTENGGIGHYGTDLLFLADSEGYKLYTETEAFTVDLRDVNHGGSGASIPVQAPDGLLSCGFDSMQSYALPSGIIYHDLEIIPWLTREPVDPELFERLVRSDDGGTPPTYYGITLDNLGADDVGRLYVVTAQNNLPTFKDILPGGLIQITNYDDQDPAGADCVPESDTMYRKVMAVTHRMITLERAWETAKANISCKMNYIGPPVQAIPTWTGDDAPLQVHGAGKELITNGDFELDADGADAATTALGWDLGDDITRVVADHRCAFDGSGTDPMVCDNDGDGLGLQAGHTYCVKLSIRVAAGTTITTETTITLGGETFTVGTHGDVADSTSVCHFVTVSTVGTDGFSITPSGAVAFYVDGVSVREVLAYGTVTIDNDDGNGFCVITAANPIWDAAITVDGVDDQLFDVDDTLVISNSGHASSQYSWDGHYKVHTVTPTILTISPTPINGGDAVSAIIGLMFTRTKATLASPRLSGVFYVGDTASKGDREAWE